MAFGAHGLVVGDPAKKSAFDQLQENEERNRDRINGDNAFGHGEAGHDHSGGGNGVFSPPYDFSESSDEGEDTTASGSYVEKLSHSFTPATPGDYMIQWQAEITHDSIPGIVNVQADLDSGTQLGICIYSPVGANDYCVFSGFYIATLTAAAHTLDIDFLRGSGSGNAKIRRARVATWRVA